MKKNLYLRAFYLPFILWWALLVGCYQGQPEKSNPFEAGDPFNLQATPSYGQVHLSWQTPSNLEGKQPIFQINRKLSNTSFSLLISTTQTTFIDAAIYQEATYRVSVSSGSLRSEFSEKSARPFPTPNKPSYFSPSGNFRQGIRSGLNLSWIYVEENAQIRVLDIASNRLLDDLTWTLNSAINNYTIARLNNTEYIFAATADSSIGFCKVEGDHPLRLSDSISLQYEPTALTASSPDDSCIYAALYKIERSSVFIYICKINFITHQIIRRKRLAGGRITFLAFSQARSPQLFFISAASTKVFMLDNGLSKLDSARVETTPNNIAFSPDSKFIFVSCQGGEKIYSFKIDGGSFAPTETLISRENANERFRWIDVAAGEASDVLLFNLVYDQAKQKHRVDIYQASAELKNIQKVRTLDFLPQNVFLTEVNAVSYIRDSAQKWWNLYIFAKDRIYYFLP